jgi:hypothetical protein
VSATLIGRGFKESSGQPPLAQVGLLPVKTQFTNESTLVISFVSSEVGGTEDRPVTVPITVTNPDGGCTTLQCALTILPAGDVIGRDEATPAETSPTTTARRRARRRRTAQRDTTNDPEQKPQR